MVTAPAWAWAASGAATVQAAAPQNRARAAAREAGSQALRPSMLESIGKSFLRVVGRKRGVGDGDRRAVRMAHLADAGEAQQLRQLVGGHLQRAGRIADTRRRQRIGGTTNREEGDVTLHLLHDLVDVPVQDGD